MNRSASEQIDAVITWVDGNDPLHKSRRTRVLKEGNTVSVHQLPTGHNKTRFLDNGEVEWCIKSIRKFAPWIRNIYLVTDNQVPDFLDEKSKKKFGVTLVDHTDIFKSYEWALPTFNTRSIESVLWRIPGLSEKFIYFNDDFVLTSPLRPEHFFEGNRIIVRGTWRKITRYGNFRMRFNHTLSKAVKKLLGITRSMHLLLQIRSAELAGFDSRYYYVPHVPHPVRRSTLETFFGKHPDLFEKNIKYKFRDTDQFSAIFLSYHLEIANNQADTIRPEKALMINGEMDVQPVLRRKIHAIEKSEVDFVCIQALEAISQKQKKHLMKTLSALIEGK